MHGNISVQCRHSHPHLLDPTNKRIRENQNVGTTASLKLGFLCEKGLEFLANAITSFAWNKTFLSVQKSQM